MGDRELAFFAVPFAICLIFVFLAVRMEAGENMFGLVLMTVLAIFALIVGSAFSPDTVYLGTIPHLREQVGASGLGAAAIVIWWRAKRDVNGFRVLQEVLLPVLAFTVVAVLPVLSIIVLGSMNPD